MLEDPLEEFARKQADDSEKAKDWEVEYSNILDPSSRTFGSLRGKESENIISLGILVIIKKVV